MTQDDFESGSETLAAIDSVEDVSYDGDVVLSAAVDDVRTFATETAGEDVEFESGDFAAPSPHELTAGDAAEID